MGKKLKTIHISLLTSGRISGDFLRLLYILIDKLQTTSHAWASSIHPPRHSNNAVARTSITIAPPSASRAPRPLPVCSMDTLRGLLDGKASDIVNSIRDAKCEDLEGLETHAKVAANFVRLAQAACKNPAARQTLGGFVIIMSPS